MSDIQDLSRCVARLKELSNGARFPGTPWLAAIADLESIANRLATMEVGSVPGYIDPDFVIEQTNAAQLKFRVRVVMRGDRYGLGGRLEHKNAVPLVEWYDASFDHKFPYPGHFISRYNLTTLAGWRRGRLILDAGVPDWVVDADNVGEAVAFAKGCEAAWGKG